MLGNICEKHCAKEELRPTWNANAFSEVCWICSISSQAERSGIKTEDGSLHC